MDRVYCTKCGAENDGGNRFCTTCGGEIESSATRRAADAAHRREEVEADAGKPARDFAAEKTSKPEWKTCPKCGAINDLLHSFCISCGAFVPEGDDSQGARSFSGHRESRPPKHDWSAYEPAAPPPNLPLATDGIGEIVSKSFSMYMGNFGVFFGAYWVITLVIFVAALIAMGISMVIPIIGNFAQWFVQPIIVGIFVVYLAAIRGHYADIGMAFNCLSEKYVPALIATIIESLMMMIPSIVVIVIAMGPLFMRMFTMGPSMGQTPGNEWEEFVNFFKDAAAGIVIAVILLSLMQMFFLFVLLLIADHNIDFWRAIMGSIKFVWANFLEVLLVSIVASIIVFAGILVLFIGFFFTAPLYFLIITAYYESRKHLFDV